MGLSDLMVGAEHLAAQNGGYEPQRNNNGLLIIRGLNFAGIDLNGPLDTLTLSLERFVIPKQSNEVISLRFLNADRKVAGRKMLEGFDVSYKDMVDRPTASTLWNWRNQVLSPSTEAIGLARDYKKRAEIVLFGPDGSSTRKYSLHGVWPSAMDLQNIDMNGNDKLLIDMTLQIDRFMPMANSWASAISDILAGNVISIGN